MDIDVKYLTDSRGRRRAVQISYADWKKVQRELAIGEFRASLQQSFAEINEMEAGRQPKVTLDEFLSNWDREQAERPSDGD